MPTQRKKGKCGSREKSQALVASGVGGHIHCFIIDQLIINKNKLNQKGKIIHVLTSTNCLVGRLDNLDGNMVLYAYY